MENLCSTIKEFFEDFDFTIQDLQNPTQRSVIDFYNRVLVELEVNVDNIAKPQFGQLQPEDPDILPRVNFLAVLRMVFPFIDIGIFDLLNPSPKRNFQHVKKVMEFLNFCESVAEKLDYKMNPYAAARAQEKELLQQKEMLNQKLNSLAIEKDNCSQRKTMLELKFEEKKRELQAIVNSTNLLTVETDNLKGRKSEVVNKVKAVEYEIENVEKELKDLQKEIVQEAGVSQAEIEKQKMDKQKLEQMMGKLWEQIKEKKDDKKQLQSSLKIVEDNRKELDEAIKLIETYRTGNTEKVILEKEKCQLIEEKETYMRKAVGIDQFIEKERENTVLQMKEVEKEIEEVKNTISKNNEELKAKVKEQKRKKDEGKKYEEELLAANRRIAALKMEYKQIVGATATVKHSIEAANNADLEKFEKLLSELLHKG